jgi:NAD-dependent histone deacetylase SIR2
MGTSLVVFPFASLTSSVGANAARVLINREESGNMDFTGEEKRDMFLQGDCDEVVLNLIDAAGWREEYEEIRTRVIPNA